MKNTRPTQKLLRNGKAPQKVQENQVKRDIVIAKRGKTTVHKSDEENAALGQMLLEAARNS